MSVTGEFKSELPLDMFSNTVTQIYSRANDRSSQLVGVSYDGSIQ